MDMIELVGIGVAFMAPVYGGLWYLVILGTGNRERVNDLQRAFKELKDKFEACRVCRREQ